MLYIHQQGITCSMSDATIRAVPLVMFYHPRGRNLACLTHSCIPIISHKPSTKQLFNKYQLQYLNGKLKNNGAKLGLDVYKSILCHQSQATRSQRATESHVEKDSNSRLFKHPFQSPCNPKHSPNKTTFPCLPFVSSSFAW